MVIKSRALKAISQLEELAAKYNEENHVPGVDQLDVAGTAAMAKEYIEDNTANNQKVVTKALVALCRAHGVDPAMLQKG